MTDWKQWDGDGKDCPLKEWQFEKVETKHRNGGFMRSMPNWPLWNWNGDHADGADVVAYRFFKKDEAPIMPGDEVWTPHTRGDDMPCRSHEMVFIDPYGMPKRAGALDWSKVTRWRYDGERGIVKRYDESDASDANVVIMELDQLLKEAIDRANQWKKLAESQVSIKDEALKLLSEATIHVPGAGTGPESDGEYLSKVFNLLNRVRYDETSSSA